MTVFPKIKKKIGDFLSKEDGKISKEKLIKTGVVVSAIAIASIKSVEACSHPNGPTPTSVHHCNSAAWSGNSADHDHGRHTSY